MILFFFSYSNIISKIDINILLCLFLFISIKLINHDKKRNISHIRHRIVFLVYLSFFFFSFVLSLSLFFVFCSGVFFLFLKIYLSPSLFFFFFFFFVSQKEIYMYIWLMCARMLLYMCKVMHKDYY